MIHIKLIMSFMKKILFLLLCILCAVSMYAEKIPHAVIFTASGKLLFTYAENGTYNIHEGGVSAVYTGDQVINSGSGNPEWYNWNGNVTNVEFDPSFASLRPKSTANWFNDCNKLTSIVGMKEYLNTSEVTNMSHMFYKCSSIASIDASGFNTSNVTDMSNMFSSCNNLTSLNVSSFNTANVTTMKRMFDGCMATSLDLHSFNVSNVKDMYQMFRGCTALSTIFCDGTWSCSNSNQMFVGCTSLVGGMGAAYNSSNLSVDYAHPNENGYFTSSTYTISLADDADNNTVISEALNQGKRAVKLADRTLYKDGDWNTLCLPFTVTEEMIAQSSNPLHGATIKELNASGSSLNDAGLLTIDFTDATSIDAGKPYIVKWAEGTNITEPFFKGVTLTSTTPTAVEFTNTKGNNCQFVGQYSPFTIDSDNINEIVLLTSGNKLGYSKNNRTLKACRAHFLIPTTVPQQAAARSFSVSIGGEETTGIISVEHTESSVQNGYYYDLSGRRLSGTPTEKGVYIINGKKVMMK